MRRIERLINLIAALLEAARPMTADEIRHRIAGYEGTGLEAFRRTFERDKEALREMGVPLEVRSLDAFSEQADAYIIPKDRYYLPELDLASDELAALKLASEAILGRGEKAAEAGLLKLSLGEEPPGWRGPRALTAAELAVEEPRLGEIYAALVERRPIRFTYEDARGQRSTRTLHTWSLVHRAGYWYAVGADADTGERRTFKLSRIRSPVRSLPGTYEIPEGLEPEDGVPAEPWEFGADEVGPVTVRFDAGVRWWAEQNLAHLDLRDAPEGALDVGLPTGNVAALLGWVLGWHGAVTVVSPADVRQRLLEHLAPYLDEAAT